jgi:hypothetical protein
MKFYFTGDILHAGKIVVEAQDRTEAFARMEHCDFAVLDEASKGLGFDWNGEEPETV